MDEWGIGGVVKAWPRWTIKWSSEIKL